MIKQLKNIACDPLDGQLTLYHMAYCRGSHERGGKSLLSRPTSCTHASSERATQEHRALVLVSQAFDRDDAKVRTGKITQNVCQGLD